ncbi:DUF4825 domain-containing protein [Alicyclobacillus fastidiosus]|uniref:DUF4825 domain-containing protein n=1 Tax=Alicyclobacillus fastidiosus TaxID=392011 RepID=A0ABY6ZHK7_9BACL|nr:DUF4825 domain-containing protein [Alicyclobacillus fastidiosus]WAH42327.1 DUF4825 domain-containing protein [Alicyclobacillus fastidiosus]GMA64135.1 hypothetical protein GCM10025859_45750 [Alicyclobacillus fastidiosus]
MTKRRNVLIIVLLIIGVIALCVVEFGVKARLRQQQAYQVAQLNPLTNDFANIVKFKNPYMGNNANDANLNANLPLANVPHTFVIHPQTRELDIRYTETIQDIGFTNVQSSLVYNATANFALIDNLDSMRFVFPGASYHVTRALVQSWYGVAPATLANQTAWKQNVQSKLANPQYVKNAFKAFFGGGS